jgi:hypothetical protein
VPPIQLHQSAKDYRSSKRPPILSVTSCGERTHNWLRGLHGLCCTGCSLQCGGLLQGQQEQRRRQRVYDSACTAVETLQRGLRASGKPGSASSTGNRSRSRIIRHVFRRRIGCEAFSVEEGSHLLHRGRGQTAAKAAGVGRWRESDGEDGLGGRRHRSRGSRSRCSREAAQLSVICT